MVGSRWSHSDALPPHKAIATRPTNMREWHARATLNSIINAGAYIKKIMRFELTVGVWSVGESRAMGIGIPEVFFLPLVTFLLGEAILSPCLREDKKCKCSVIQQSHGFFTFTLISCQRFSSTLRVCGSLSGYSCESVGVLKFHTTCSNVD